MTKTETDFLEIRVDADSRIPKYRQIVNSIVEDIKRGTLAVGQRIPSINEISEEYYLSRDTVEKAYCFLKEKQIIVSARGKGYYVARTDLSSRTNVFFLVNKLSPFKLQIYNAFVTSLGSRAQVDLHVYNGDPHLLINALNEQAGRYDFYVVIPHFCEHLEQNRQVFEEVIDTLGRIPEDKLMIMDNYLPELKRNVGAVYQDFRMDIYEALQEASSALRSYSKLILVNPQRSGYPFVNDIARGFRCFCTDYDFEFDVIDALRNESTVKAGDAYIVVEESELVALIKKIREQNLILGQETGVISYNDSPLKDLLGITVISTDFQAMGETAAYMIMKKKREAVKNVFSFIRRSSL